MIHRRLELIEISLLIETEEHCEKDALKLSNRIKFEGVWKLPIAIEESSLGVMDGHHRLAAARLLNLQRIPCLLMNYNSGEVTLRSWKKDLRPTIEDFFLMISSQKKFPIKTTRHIINPPIQEISIPLNILY